MHVDAEVIAGLEELGGDELVARLLRTFVDHAPERLEALRAAAAARDAPAMARVFHSLRSSSATVGAAGLAGLAAELERAADEGRAAEVASRLPELERSLARSVAALESEVRRRTPEPGA